MVLKLVTHRLDVREIFLGKWPFQHPSYGAVTIVTPHVASP